MDRVTAERAPLVSITHGGRRDPPAVAARRFRRAGRDLRRPGRAPGPHRRRPSPVCRLPGPAGGDARGRPGRRAVGLRAGVPGRLGGLPAPAGRHPPGAARPAAGPRGRTGQGRVHRAGPARRAQPGRRAAAPGRGRAGGSRLPAGRRSGVPPAQPPGPGSARRLDAGRGFRALAEPRRVGHAAVAARPAVGRHRQRARRAHRPRRGRRGASGLGRRDGDRRRGTPGRRCFNPAGAARLPGAPP